MEKVPHERIHPDPCVTMGSPKSYSATLKQWQRNIHQTINWPVFLSSVSFLSSSILAFFAPFLWSATFLRPPSPSSSESENSSSQAIRLSDARTDTQHHRFNNHSIYYTYISSYNIQVSPLSTNGIFSKYTKCRSSEHSHICVFTHNKIVNINSALRYQETKSTCN